jgi:Zn-dependent peptidase ImmA (M78 family)
VLKDDSYLRSLVEKALRSAGYEEPPVSIDTVAASLGVPVIEVPLPPWFTAALVYDDGLPAVMINEMKQEETKHRALGHLLGHLLVLLDDMTANYPKDRITQHSEADLMAEEFETPSYMVREQAQKWFNDYRYLAGLFGVPESQMFDKMRDLGLIKSRGIIWDY